jgi:hypothetical protein
VSGSDLNRPLLGMTLNKNVLKNIGGEITDGILLNWDAQKIKVIAGGEIICPLLLLIARVGRKWVPPRGQIFAGLDLFDPYRQTNSSKYLETGGPPRLTISYLLSQLAQHVQKDHKTTPQLISFLFEIRFQQAIHQIKGFKKYYKLDIKCCP